MALETQTPLAPARFPKDSMGAPCYHPCNMNALLLKEYMKLEMTAMPEPEIAADEVLIRVRACGICGSDVHGLDGSPAGAFRRW